MIGWAFRQRRAILFSLALMVLAGIFVINQLPVSLFPQIIFPRIVVNLDVGDKPAERMVIETTIPVEQAVRSVPGVVSVRSTSTRGSTDISINFLWGTDMLAAMLQVEAAVNQTRSHLPATLNFNVRRMEPTVFPVLGYSLTSAVQSDVKLRDIADYQITPLLASIPGVAKIEVLGGAIAEYQVLIASDKLRNYNLGLDEVAKTLAANNVLQAVGRLEQYFKLYLVLADQQYKNTRDIGLTVIRHDNNGVLLLKDIASIKLSTTPQWQRVRADGKEAVLFQVIQQPDASTVEIADAVQEKLQQFRQRTPADVQIAKWYDQGDLIKASAHTVIEALLIGLALAILILLIFLRNTPVTLIAAITVPMALAATTLILYCLGQSFNIMTLGGMAAAVALIIDDAIVMIEHIIRRLSESNEATSSALKTRIQVAAAEFSKPLAASSAATIVTHIPLAFLSGVSGGFFKALSLTIASVLSLSFLVAWLAVPLLAAQTLAQIKPEPKTTNNLSTGFQHGYCRLLQNLLPRPWLIFSSLAVLIIGGVIAEQSIGSGFMPAMDEGGFVLDYRADSGTAVTETDRLLQQVETIIQQTPEVETYSRRTGLSLGGHITEANEGDFFIRRHHERYTRQCVKPCTRA